LRLNATRRAARLAARHRALRLRVVVVHRAGGVAVRARHVVRVTRAGRR
jgi:hypothetical protein